MRRCSRLCVTAVLLVAGCKTSAVVGTYTDGGGRCDPLAASCGDDGGRDVCTLRADPAMDACHAAGALVVHAGCTALDACEAGSQCASIAATSASLDPSRIAMDGVCSRVCARDAPLCDAGERCLAVDAAGGGVRIDFGVCAR